MIFLWILFASLVAVDAQQIRPGDYRFRPRNPGLENMMNQPSSNPHPKHNTIIENKNVNIIVNVDPKLVAEELHKILLESFPGYQPGRRSFAGSTEAINELEEIVKRTMMPNRRSQKTSAFETAYALEHLTRRAVTSNHLKHPTIDDEIVTREIVARMMRKLKDITENGENRNKEISESTNTRKMLIIEKIEHEINDPDEGFGNNANSGDDDDDDFITFNLKIRKTDLLKSAGRS